MSSLRNLIDQRKIQHSSSRGLSRSHRGIAGAHPRPFPTLHPVTITSPFETALMKFFIFIGRHSAEKFQRTASRPSPCILIGPQRQLQNPQYVSSYWSALVYAANQNQKCPKLRAHVGHEAKPGYIIQ